MDTDGLSLICSGLGAIEEDDEGKRIGYSKGEYCLGMNEFVSFFHFFIGLDLIRCRFVMINWLFLFLGFN